MNIGVLTAILRAVDEVSPVYEQVRANTRRMGTDFQQVGAIATAALTVPLVGLATAAVRVGTEFETTMNAIQGVLGPTGDQMELVRQKAVQMGAETAFSANDAATAMLELGRSGFTVTESLDSVDEVMQLAAASGLEMGRAAEIASRTLNAFGLETSDLAHVNDVLAQAVNSTSLEIEDLRLGFQYIGPIAQGLGMSLEQTSAALGIMRDNGIAAETAGRALREGLTRLLNPTQDVHEGLGRMNLSIEQLRGADGALLPLDQIISVLGPHAANTGALMQVFGDAAGPGLSALVRAGSGALVSLTNDLQQSQGAAQRMADAMMSGMPGAMERMRGSVETAFLAISRAIGPAVVAAVGFVERLANIVTTVLVPAFTRLPMPVQMVVIGLAALAAAIGPLLFLIGTTLTAFSTLGGSAVALAAYNGLLSLSFAGLEARLLALGMNTGPMAVAAVRALHVVYGTQIVVTNALTAATTFWNGVILATAINVQVLGARLAATSAATAIAGAAASVTAAAKGLLAAAINLVSGSSLAMGVRLAASTVATAAAGAAAATSSVGLTALGTALLGVQYVLLPLTVAFVSFKATLALLDWSGASDKIEYFSLRLRGIPADLARLTIESRNAAAATAGTTQQFDAAATAAQSLRDRITGAGLARDMQALTQITEQLTRQGGLTPAVLQRIATEARNLQAQGMTLSPALQAVIDRMRAVAPAAVSFTQELERARAVVAGLSTEQRSNIDAALRMGASTEDVIERMRRLYPNLQLSEAALRLLKDQMEASARSTKTLKDATEDLAQKTREYYNWVGERAIEAERERQEAVERSATAMRAIWNQYYEDEITAYGANEEARRRYERELTELVESSTLSRLEFELRQIERWAEDQRRALDGNAANWREASAAIDQVAGARAQALILQTQGMRAALGSLGTIFPGLIGYLHEFGAALDGTTDSGSRWSRSWDSITEGLERTLLSIPQTLVRAFEGGGDIMGAVQSIASQIGATIGGGIGEYFGGPLGRAVGEALGSLLGPLVGAIGRLFRNEHTEQVRKYNEQIAELRDNFLDTHGPIERVDELATALGMTLASPMLGHQGAEGMRAWIEFTEEFERRLAAVHEEMGRIAESGGLATPELMRFIETMRDTAEVTDFLRGQLDRASEGLATWLESGTEALTRMRETEDSRTEALQRMGEIEGRINQIRREMMTAEGSDRERLQRQLEEQLRAFNEQDGTLRRLNETLVEQQRLYETVGVTTQASATAAAAAIGALFAEYIQGGMSVTEALAQIEPAAAALEQQLAQAGLTGGAAFDQIREYMELARDEIAGPALNAVQGINQAFQGLHNTGLLNQEMFTGLAGQVANTFNMLIAQGANGDAALRMMQPTLQTIWRLQQDFGYEVDESTQLLLDQAEAAGVVGDQHRDANDRAARAMERVATELGNLITRLDEMGRRGEAAGRDIERSLGGVQGNLGGVADFSRRVGDEMETMGRRGTAAARELGEAVDDISRMQSPTGLEGIILYSGLAGQALASMADTAVPRLQYVDDVLHGISRTIIDDCGGALDDFVVKIDDTFGRAVDDAGKKWQDLVVVIDDDAPGKAIDDLVVKIDDTFGRAIDDTAGKWRDLVDLMGDVVAMPGPASLPPGVSFGASFDVGTLGRYGSFFHDFGAGLPATLHRTEAVITPGQAVPFAQSVLGGGGGGAEMEREIKGLRRELTDLTRALPGAMAFAVRDAIQTSGLAR